MTNEIIVRDNLLNELTRIENVINPLISEQINDHYTFKFETVVDENIQYLHGKNIIEIENDYFRVAKVVKHRDTSINVMVDCEHISYDLLDKNKYPLPFENEENEEEDEEENEEENEYDGDIRDLVLQLLSATPFNLGILEAWGNYKIKLNSDNIRGALIEIANLTGCELEYKKYTIDLVNRRGVISDQEFRLGENLIGVTEEIDFTEGFPRRALEVDVIDLSQVKGYEYLLTIGLGDTVTTIDPVLNINETLRIVSKEYNPFQKINPRVEMGNVIRDYEEYTEKKEEKDDVNSKIIDALSNMLVGTALRVNKTNERLEEIEKSLDEAYMETGTKNNASGGVTFTFANQYEHIVSVTAGVIGGNANTGVTLIKDGDVYVGAKVTCSSSNTSYKISLQAICSGKVASD